MGVTTIAAVVSCTSLPQSSGNEEARDEWIDLSKRDKPEAVTSYPWQEVIITVTDLDNVAPLFTDIGSFETVERSETSWTIRAPGSDSGYVRFVKTVDPNAKPARPVGSEAWDKGCYFSVMMRAKDMPSIVKDAAALGWKPHTEIAYYEFGPSKLNIVVLTHESGVRVQLYERLTTPLPEGFTPFERLSRPFNIMQMVEDRDAAYSFFQQGLGFETFFYGPPYLAEEKKVMPLGIPLELTTTIPYKTGIVMPSKGAEWGRMEMIDIEGMSSTANYADRCNADHTGIIGVRFPVDDIQQTQAQLSDRGIRILFSDASSISVKTPDGANIEFYQE